jgi:UDP-N-acetylglucosamine transferase subunit ALG13
MMIFATVGTQLPFDRLIRELDGWAERNPQVDVLGQIGLSSYKPCHMRWARMLPEKRFRECLRTCDAVVAHAGMGTIISGLEYGKRVIVMPRRADHGEHRNDHQVATASRLCHLQGLEVVHSERDLAGALDDVGSSHAYSSESVNSDLFASPQLISEIRHFAGLEAR